MLDAIIDPFFDIYLNQTIKYLNYNGRYITCGFYHQNSLFNFEKTDKNNCYFQTLLTCMSKNISIIGNCLGLTCDLNDAIDDYSNGIYDITIDSVFSGKDVLPFHNKTFHELPRFGKVV